MHGSFHKYFNKFHLSIFSSDDQGFEASHHFLKNRVYSIVGWSLDWFLSDDYTWITWRKWRIWFHRNWYSCNFCSEFYICCIACLNQGTISSSESPNVGGKPSPSHLNKSYYWIIWSRPCRVIINCLWRGLVQEKSVPRIPIFTLKKFKRYSLKNYDWIFDRSRGISCPRNPAFDFQTTHIGKCDEKVWWENW